MDRIILASQSPRRKQLLTWAEINFEVIVPQTDETYPPDMPLQQVPEFIARNKALAVKQCREEGSIILAADTIVVLDKQIIGKPADRKEALEMLSRLSGKEHQVTTGVVMIGRAKEISFAETTSVRFFKLRSAQIEYYVDKYKPFDKAGAYAIQEWIGVIGIESINGDFYNVMGLPVSRVVSELQDWGN